MNIDAMPGSTKEAEQGLVLDGLRSPLAGPFSLTLAPGAAAVITGRSGSGKSLFLRMVADLDVNNGEARLNGTRRTTLSAPSWRRRVAYVAADAGWWADRVADHLPPDRLQEAEALAERLGLERALVSVEVARLSSGERQRLALIRAILRDPEILLLDEPTGALDEGSTRRVEDLLHALMRDGKAIVMVTHDPALAERFGGARYEMADRQLSPR